MLSELNNEQRRAVETGDGPLMIMAGPGTGKTKTLTERILYLLEVKKIQPKELLALTFTTKAAAQMRQRVEARLKTRRLPRIMTFHALCYELLTAGGMNKLEFIGEHERLLVIKELRKAAALKSLTTRELGLAISRLKNQPTWKAADPPIVSAGTVRSQIAHCLPPGNVEPAETIGGSAAAQILKDQELANLLTLYNQALRERNLYDFDDLVQQAHELLSAKRIDQYFTHILVDEFQDTNALQYELLQLLRTNDNLCVIGDPRQSIYGFRGASGDVFKRFQTDFPHCQSITLTTNYRSAPPIVHLANAIFPNAAALQAHRSQAGRVRAVEVLNEYGEAAWIINQIEQLLGGSDFLHSHRLDYDALPHPRTFRDFAVLYRTHYIGKVIKQDLSESGLPFQVVGEGSPYEQPAIWIIIQLLCYFIQPTTERRAALQKLANLPQFTKGQLAALLEQLQLVSGKALTEQATFIAEKLAVKPTLLPSFINSLVRFEAEPEAFVEYVNNLSGQNFYDEKADAITLLSIHAAKGLEFAHVFLLAAEEGILPHSRSDKPADIAEEKRLFYVAATRAGENLDILHAKTRGGAVQQPSSFLIDLPRDVFEQTQDEALANQLRRREKRQARRRQATLFDL